jgi:hypothetical protein
MQDRINREIDRQEARKRKQQEKAEDAERRKRMKQEAKRAKQKEQAKHTKHENTYVRPDLSRMTALRTLGIIHDSHEAIRKAYKTLALRYHPDKCSEPSAKEQFCAIQEAYEFLTVRPL